MTKQPVKVTTNATRRLQFVNKETKDKYLENITTGKSLGQSPKHLSVLRDKTADKKIKRFNKSD